MVLDSQLDGCEFDSRPPRCRVTTSGKLFTPTCLCRSHWSSGTCLAAVLILQQVLLPWERNEPGELSQRPRHDDSTINIVIGISISTTVFMNGYIAHLV